MDVAFQVAPFPIPTPLHMNYPLLEAMLKVLFWKVVHALLRFFLHCMNVSESGSF